MPAHSLVQSVIFPKSKFTQAQAESWLKNHEFKTHFRKKGVEITSDFYRYRQKDPHQFRRFRTLTLNNSVELIIGFKN